MGTDNFMRYLWATSFIMVAVGFVLFGAGVLGLLAPIALVLGLLSLWSGIVKLIVLRIWQRTLKAAVEEGPPAPPVRFPLRLGRRA
jgi:uncharacterized membrane protein YphA (DoxX/SURF4 family)